MLRPNQTWPISEARRSWDQPMTIRGAITHPMAPASVICIGAIGVLGAVVLIRPSDPSDVLAFWVVLALAAGYSISGSV